MKRFVLAAAVALLAMTAAASAQQKYTFALVPKNMNNPFFDQARDGARRPKRNRTARSNACISVPANTAAATSK